MTSRRGEAWKRRRGKLDGYDADLWRTHAEPQLWLNITSPEITDDPMDDTSNSSETPVSKTIPFERQSTGQKFKLIRLIVTPINANINKDGSICIKVKNEEVQTLLNINTIGETPVSIKKDKYKNLIRGQFYERKSVPEATEEEIIEELSSINCKSVRKIEKPKRDKEGKYIKDRDNKLIFEYSGEAVVTLELESIPATQIDFFHSKITIEQFEPKPILCKQCFSFGHPKKYCKSTIPLCGHCSQAKHCELGQKCEKQHMCKNCHSNDTQCDHPTYDQDCPSWLREKEILYIKEIQKIPYPAARAILQQRLKDSSDKRKAQGPSLDTLSAASERVWEERLAVNNANWEEKMAKSEEKWEAKVQVSEGKIAELKESIEHLTHLVQTMMVQNQQDRLQRQQDELIPAIAPPSLQIAQFSTPVRGYMTTINTKTPGKSSTSDLEHSDDSEKGADHKKPKPKRRKKGKPPDTD